MRFDSSQRIRRYRYTRRPIGRVALSVEVGMEAEPTRAYLESDEVKDRIQSEDKMACEMGISGVPCFILNRKYVVSGAQDPQVILQAINAVRQEAEQEQGNEGATAASRL